MKVLNSFLRSDKNCLLQKASMYGSTLSVREGYSYLIAHCFLLVNPVKTLFASFSHGGLCILCLTLDSPLSSLSLTSIHKTHFLLSIHCSWADILDTLCLFVSFNIYYMKKVTPYVKYLEEI